MLRLVLAAEEDRLQAKQQVLRTVVPHGDRLESEIRRAELAESRAEHAEMRTKETMAQLVHGEIESARASEEIKRYQMQLSMMESDLRRAREEIRKLESERDEAEHAAARARDIARECQMALREYQAREEGKEEARVLGMQRWYDDGYHEGFLEGQDDGFAEGLKVGRKKGLREGRELGRKEERQNARGRELPGKLYESNFEGDRDSVRARLL